MTLTSTDIVRTFYYAQIDQEVIMRRSLLTIICYSVFIGLNLAACSSNSDPGSQRKDEPVSINQTPVEQEDGPESPTDTAIPPTDTAIPPTDTAIPPTDTAIPPTNTAIPPTLTPTPVIELQMEISEGDPVRGRITAVKKGCFGCHVDPAVNGPQFMSTTDLPTIMGRGEMRIADPGYDGQATTNLEYVIESIFIPERYLVPGEWEKEMPAAFYLQITDEEVANIMAWLETLE